MKNTKSIIFVAIAVVILGGILFLNSKRQQTHITSLIPVETVDFETDMRGNVIVRDNPEFVTWAHDLLGLYGKNQEALQDSVQSAAFADFLAPDSYLESATKQKMIADINKIISLLESQKEELPALLSRINALALYNNDLDNTQLSYVQMLREKLKSETFEQDFISPYQDLIFGFEKARELYSVMDTKGASSFDELSEADREIVDALLHDVTFNIGVSADSLYIPTIPMVYTSWASIVDAGRAIQVTTLSDDDRSRLGLQDGDSVFDGEAILTTLVNSAQKCLYQIPDEKLKNTYAQIIPFIKGKNTSAYVAIISDKVINGFDVTPTSLAEGIMYPWNAPSAGFQNTYISLPDATCSPVEFS